MPVPPGTSKQPLGIGCRPGAVATLPAPSLTGVPTRLTNLGPWIPLRGLGLKELLAWRESARRPAVRLWTGQRWEGGSADRGEPRPMWAQTLRGAQWLQMDSEG